MSFKTFLVGFSGLAISALIGFIKEWRKFTKVIVMKRILGLLLIICLAGCEGPMGPQREQGEKGDRGNTGLIGSPGRQGEQGPPSDLT